MWHPDFEHVEAEIATLSGYRRGFTMRSIHHRGTETRPGLVLALDENTGESCTGLAFRVTPGHEAATMEMLRERELVSYAYLEKRLPVALADGRRVTAVTYVIDPHHVQYSGTLALEEQARVIAQAHGGRGSNADYLMNTNQHLRELGIEDGDISWLAERVGNLVKTVK